MGCTSSTGVHPDHDDLPGQQYLGRCWKLQTTEDPQWLESVPAWSRTTNGELPSRGFHFVLPSDATTGAPIRTPFLNKVTKDINGYYAPGLRCDFDGLDNSTQVLADSDIRTNTKTTLNFSVGVGVGTVEASVGAQRKEKHSTGSSDYYVVVTIETYRLSVDLSRTFYESADVEPFETSGRLENNTDHSTPKDTTQSRFVRHSVDPTDIEAYGNGCVTQVKCGGQLLIRIKQTNYGDQLKAWGASMSAGIRAGVPTIGASGQKKKKGGDIRVDVEVHHAGGPDVPAQFQNSTLDDIESMVETWSKELMSNVLLSVPLRVGVHRYTELKGQLSYSPTKVSNREAPPLDFAAIEASETVRQLRQQVAELEEQLKAVPGKPVTEREVSTSFEPMSPTSSANH